MSVLVIGLSHRTAPIALLESAAAASSIELAARVRACDAVSEVAVVATCNRLEVYAEAVTFHGAVAAIGESLAAACGVALGDLSGHLYVHYEDRAVAHAFSVACGLDSMAVGETQILGQLRDALRRAQRSGTVGESLNSLFQRALRVGKRAHTETAIDTVSHTLVEAGLDWAGETVGPLDDVHVLVVGAGGMSSLAGVTAARRGAGRLTVVNRTEAKAQRLAHATGGTSRPMGELQAALGEADVIVSSTGAVGHLLTTALVTAGHEARLRAGVTRPQVYVDLGLPRDVDPAAATLPGVRVVSLADLGERLAVQSSTPTLPEVKAVVDLVTGEVAAYLTERMAKAVGPTVAALRLRAAELVDAEMARLDQKLPGLEAETRAELQRTVHRVVEKLLHTPTVRIKRLSSEGDGGDYAAVLRDLFDLDPHDVAAVSVPPPPGGLPVRERGGTR